MAKIWYLDVDDEITKAAARIRETPEPRLAIVVPVGSRVATSRINFRLLVREAQTYGHDLAIVTPDQATRALAASAGIAAFASVAEYETAVEEADAASVEDPGDPETPGGSGGAGGTGGAPGGDGSTSGAAGGPLPGGAGGDGPARGGSPGRRRGGSKPARTEPLTTVAAATAATPAADGSRAVPSGTVPALAGVRARTGLNDAAVGRGPEPRLPDAVLESERRRGPSAWIVATLGVLLVVLVVGTVAAWVVLPAATVTVRTRAEPIGPLQLTVRADPLALSLDPTALVVPAQVVAFDLSVTDTFPATGKKVTEATASGTLRWTNCDPTRSYTIPSGTLARTSDGTDFTTTDAVFLPVAILIGNPPSITCQSRVVSATAVEPGLNGNVDAGAITVVPSAFNSVVIRVTNPAATTGGTHLEKTIVAQKDVDAAVTALTKALRDRFAAEVADPSRAPAGSTIYAATKSMSAPQPTVDPASLVGQAGPTFSLGMTGSGTATAVDPAPVEQLGETRVRAAVANDHSLVAGSVSVTVGTGRVDGSAVVFPVTARAAQVAPLDAAAIRAAVKGMSVDEARQRLRDYGDATIDTWPGWVTSITTLDFRLAVTVVSDVPTEPVGGPVASPTPSPSATLRPTLPVVPTGTPSPSTVPSASVGAGPSAPGSAAPSGSSANPTRAAVTASPGPSGT